MSALQVHDDAIAYQSARDNVATNDHRAQFRLADVLSAHASQLADDFTALAERLALVTHDLEDSQGQECPEPELHEYEELHSLLLCVRAEHNTFHPEPWSVCRHDMCREAGRRGQL